MQRRTRQWMWILFMIPGLFLAPTTGRGQEAKGEKAKEDAKLVAIGALAASQVYMTYGYIGAVGDGFAKGIYPPDKVRQMMEEVVGLCDVSAQHLKDLKLDGEDKASVDEIVVIYDMLKQQASALGNFTKTNAGPDAQTFEKARTAVWPKISKLLGLSSDKPEQPKPVEAKKQ